MSQVAVWEFRCNQDHWDDATDLTKFLHKIGKKFVFQLEEGSNSGYVHWQGRVSLWKKRRKPELMALIKGMDVEVPNYLEPTTRAEHKKEAFYCMKEETRLAGPYTDQDMPKYVPRQYRDKVLFPYQKAVLESRLEFTERTVDCIVDTAGNNGKSTLASISDLMHGCIDMPPVNDGDRLIASLCDILIAKDERQPGIIFFDLPRALGKDRLGSLYAAIEQIKKGKVYDMRYSYKEWWFDSPRCWVFTNSPPDVSMLTKDRWRFWEISADKELVPLRIKRKGVEGRCAGKTTST